MAQPYVPSNEPGQPYAQSGPQHDTGAPAPQQGAPYHPQPQYQAPPAGPGYSPQAAGSKRRYDERDDGPPDSKRQAIGAHEGPPGAETVYRLLVQSKKVGSVIGKAGAIVKQIRDETGARIRVVEGVPNCDERVIVISGRVDPGRHTDSAQEALYKVHARVHETEDGPNGPPANATTRMLVCHTQAGCLIGKAGAIIKEIREASGAHIKILPAEDLPACGLSNDRVVQISGAVDALGRALVPVSRQIRENPPKERPGGPPPQLQPLLAGAPPAGYAAAPPYGAPRYR
ncbi:g1129 [Coccomyxa elongata]